MMPTKTSVWRLKIVLVRCIKCHVVNMTLDALKSAVECTKKKRTPFLWAVLIKGGNNFNHINSGNIFKKNNRWPACAHVWCGLQSVHDTLPVAKTIWGRGVGRHAREARKFRQVRGHSFKQEWDIMAMTDRPKGRKADQGYGIGSTSWGDFFAGCRNCTSGMIIVNRRRWSWNCRSTLNEG